MTGGVRKPMATYQVDLTVPPSANRLHVTRKGGGGAKVRSSRYEAWRKTAIITVRQQLGRGAEFFGARRSWSVVIEAGIGRNRDLDNLIKPILDALVQAGVAPDDRYVDGITIQRNADVDGVRVRWAVETFAKTREAA